MDFDQCFLHHPLLQPSLWIRFFYNQSSLPRCYPLHKRQQLSPLIVLRYRTLMAWRLWWRPERKVRTPLTDHSCLANSDTGTQLKKYSTLSVQHWVVMRSRDGAVVRVLASHQCGPGSTTGPSVICGLSLLLVLVLAPRGFSLGSPVFPSPQKPTLPNSN